MREIKVENEVAKFSEMNEYLNAVIKKFRQTIAWYNNSGSTQYANYQLVVDHLDVEKSIELKTDVCTYKLVVGIRMMGTLSVEDMEQASEEIRAAARIAERFNERMNGVYVVRG